MNRWKEVWNKRNDEVTKSDDVFSMYCELKKADGFDVQTNDDYYKDLYAQSTGALDMINKYARGAADSVFEVGCGSGVNLYLWQKLYNAKCFLGGGGLFRVAGENCKAGSCRSRYFMHGSQKYRHRSKI
jgi:hypothetical protein